MSEAYQWLQTLPPSVRDELKSMEQVVSLYLRAKRLGGALPSPEELKKNIRVVPDKSPPEFQKTLKDLRFELEKFDRSGGGLQEPAPAAPVIQPTLPAAPPAASTAFNDPGAAGLQGPTLTLDLRSRQIIEEIKDALNLSSDSEVIRMSLVIAHKRLKDLIS